MAWRFSARMDSAPPSVLAAGGTLLVSIVLYGLFLMRFVIGEDSVLTSVAAWHIPVALLALVLSLYAAVRHRSSTGLGLLVCSVLALLTYFLFTVA